MTDCERNLEYISAYLDGELSAAEAAQLQSHLEVCPSCKALLEDLTAIRDNLAEGAVEGLPELPEGLHEQIMDAVRSERKVVSRAPVLWRRWGVLAAALAIVVVSATYGQNMLRMGSTGTADTATMAPASTNSAAGAVRPRKPTAKK
jgi:anti-sigma factor RsiW